MTILPNRKTHSDNVQAEENWQVAHALFNKGIGLADNLDFIEMRTVATQSNITLRIDNRSRVIRNPSLVNYKKTNGGTIENPLMLGPWVAGAGRIELKIFGMEANTEYQLDFLFM